MGVYIKGFRKPTYCQECPLTFDYDCMIQHEQRDSLIDQYKHCPIVEVTEPHGRLIDADRLKPSHYEEIYADDEYVYKYYSEDDIGTAPTVIEAEGE